MIEGGYFVHPDTLDEIAAAAHRVADGVQGVGDDAAKVSTFDPRGDWMLGDASIDLVGAWDGFLHTFAEDVRELGGKIGKASKFYSDIEEEFSAGFQRILP